MKKLLSLLAMVGVLGVAGCSCSKEGVYKFDSLILTEGEEEKTYTCGEGEERDDEIDMMCEFISGIEMELKDDKATIKYIVDGEEVDGMGNESADYKIEDGKFMIKEEDEEKYEEAGTYEDGKIIMGMDEGIKVVLAKE